MSQPEKMSPPGGLEETLDLNDPMTRSKLNAMFSEHSRTMNLGELQDLFQIPNASAGSLSAFIYIRDKILDADGMEVWRKLISLQAKVLERIECEEREELAKSVVSYEVEEKADSVLVTARHKFTDNIGQARLHWDMEHGARVGTAPFFRGQAYLKVSVVRNGNTGRGGEIMISNFKEGMECVKNRACMELKDKMSDSMFLYGKAGRLTHDERS